MTRDVPDEGVSSRARSGAEVVPPRYPSDPRAVVALARARLASGDAGTAILELEDVIAATSYEVLG